MYFREFGNPARVARCFSKEDIEKQVAKHNGKKNCYASVYVFDSLSDIDGKTDYDSAIIDTLWFDFDDKKDIKKCLTDVRKLIKKYCKPNNITPRVYLTGGKGYQVNIDLYDSVDFPNTEKRRVLREYLMHIKKEYKLKTMDEACINNSVTCLRRIPNTAYISKLTNEPIGVNCIALTVDEVLKLSVEEQYGLAHEHQEVPKRQPSKRALRDFVDFACDMFGVEHTVSNSVTVLYDRLKQAAGIRTRGSTGHNSSILAPRKSIIELIEKNIARGDSSHQENNVIALELMNAGKTDQEISFVFACIYDEPAGDWGWYTDNPEVAGEQITKMRAKGLSRYSDKRLQDMGILGVSPKPLNRQR